MSILQTGKASYLDRVDDAHSHQVLEGVCGRVVAQPAAQRLLFRLLQQLPCNDCSLHACMNKASLIYTWKAPM